MRTQVSPCFSLTVSGLLCRRIASRHTPDKVGVATDFSEPSETFAAAADDTGDDLLC